MTDIREDFASTLELLAKAIRDGKTWGSASRTLHNLELRAAVHVLDGEDCTLARMLDGSLKP